jgi:hypothetical protein
MNIDETCIKILPENLEGGDRLRDLVVDKSIILIWILEKQDMKLWAVSIWLRTGTSGGLL